MKISTKRITRAIRPPFSKNFFQEKGLAWAKNNEDSDSFSVNDIG
jgi:hypothetical protein